MNNNEIADNFSLLAKLMDIHGDNSFKAKSYSSAAFNIEKFPDELSTLANNEIFALKGIGETIGKKILEVIDTGRISELDNYLEKTPPGILEMLRIKGLGPKKIATIWKDLEVETIGELLYACTENRLLNYKGFGAKTQQNIRESIEFYLNNAGSYLYAQVESYAAAWEEKIAEWFPQKTFYCTGDFRRQLLIIDKLEWVTGATVAEIEKAFNSEIYTTEIDDSIIKIKGPENLLLQFYCTPSALLFTKLFATSCSEEFMNAWKNKFSWDDAKQYSAEEEIFTVNKIEWIPPYLREKPYVIDKALGRQLPQVITTRDIKAIIHSHSNWSDGSNTLEQMVKGAIEKGFEYLVISDHSKSAFYAGGLYPDKIILQHKLIDDLNEKYKPFKIFKSIESDILNDGSLDYDDSVLASFDLVITSVHSNLKMNQEKAMMRLMNAIANPYTTILGHMTGRLLLSRRGYPVDYETIINACAKHNVVIELNAHPRRLDMDWQWINVALEKGVLISIDPDAHSIDEYNNIKYGVLAAQKGGLTKENNVSSFSLQQFEAFLEEQREKRK
ncbi:MAG: polymerase/3-5 exonuclease PolX [Chitinophagaceae bacterium]|nr:polymerase/3-5 exonuclease PolX [Chitinophagaceae bacterium]